MGRLKLNTKLGLNTRSTRKILHPQDFYEVIKYLLKLRKNLRTSTTSITLATGASARSASCSRTSSASGCPMERAIKEKMSVYQEMATAMPHD